MTHAEIIFNVTRCQETAGYVARWDAGPGLGGITTEGDTLSDLEEMVADAVIGFFEVAERPRLVRLHFAEDPVLDLEVAA